MKRLLILISVLILLVAAGAALYFFYFAPTPHLTVGTANTFGETSGNVTPTNTETATNGGTGTVVAPGLVEITSSPIAAGEIILDIPATLSTTSPVTTGSSTIPTNSTVAPGADTEVRYIDRESGNIYAYRAQARTLTRISNKTLPGIQEASWLSDGSLAFARFLASADGTETLDTYALPATGDSGYFLQQGLSQVTVVGSSTLLTLNAGTDSSIASTAHSDGTNPKSLFSSPLTSILVQGAGNTYIAVTKAASEVNGYAFSVSASGTLTPVIGPLPGLTALLSPSGKSILYSYVSGSALHMNVLNLTDGSVTALPLATLAEKCTWAYDSNSLYCAIPTAVSGNLPDNWYQGVTSFNDRIWHIDMQTRLATLVLDPTQVAKTSIDAVNLTIDPESKLLVFRNKKDSSLWAYNL